MTTRRRRHDPYTRTVVRLPERDLADSILQLAAPLLEPLGLTPPSDDVRHAIELAVSVWNAHVAASHLWGDPRPKALSELRNAMCGKQAPTGAANSFELLSERWRKEFSLDPRIVGAWLFEAKNGGGYRLACEMALPDGVEAEVPPPVEKRIAIGGQFLDEVRVRQSETSFLSFPVESHRGEVGSDGVITIHAKLLTAFQLFAEGHLLRVGGAPVELMIGGKPLGPVVLSEVRCASNGGYYDVAVLVFRQAAGATKSRE